MARVTMAESDLARAEVDGVWYPLCPCCALPTPAEPDAQLVYCLHCDQLIEIENPFY